ncbi:amidohydrolase [Sphingomonas hengshuiensis]|uniref:amidohydrolase n=1 Tax=Sphingomonas hengshuiensis TaxID=1609977 RepID=UPI0005C816D3|nr:amidohydrolase [Sphingomonas hengshuiensis]
MNRKTFLAALAATCCLSTAAFAQAVDTVFINGKVYTADEKDDVVQAFAVNSDRIVAAGSNARIRKLVGPETKVVDLKGKFVMPGLTDDHFHGAGGGPGVPLADVRSMAEVVSALRKAADAAVPGQVIVTNADWHEAQLTERRKPTIADLDAASTTVPIVVLRGGHSMFLNSAALAKFGVDATTATPPGGSIEKTPDGQLTGELVDAATRFVKIPRPPAMKIDDVIRTQQVMNSYGATAVRIPGAFMAGPVLELRTMAQQLRDRGELTLRYTLMRPGPGFAGATLEALKTGPQQGDGDEWVRVDGVKLAVDGGFEGAHFDHPYAEPFGKNGTYSGIALVPTEKTVADVLALQQMGWHIGVHAAGDEGVEQALEAFEAADKVAPIKGQRWSLEHAFLYHEGQIERIKRLGVAMSLQDHLYLAAPSMEQFWGRKWADKATPAKTYMDAGLLVAGGTDAPVIPPSPIWALYHFASRDTISAGVYGKEEAMPRPQVLRMFTINYAKLVGAEKVRGSIEPGKLADFAVFDTDLLGAPVTAIRDAKALATYVGGRQVYAAPGVK